MCLYYSQPVMLYDYLASNISRNNMKMEIKGKKKLGLIFFLDVRD